MEDFAIVFERAMKAKPKREKKIIMLDMRHECTIDGTARLVVDFYLSIEEKLTK